MKEFIGTCVENPFGRIEELTRIFERVTEITKRTFLKHCIVTPELRVEFNRFPNDFYFAKSDGIYFYEWSMIEHFYK